MEQVWSPRKKIFDMWKARPKFAEAFLSFETVTDTLPTPFAWEGVTAYLLGIC